MSVPMLLAAVAQHPRPFLAIVSIEMYLDLQLRNELDVAFHPVTISTDPKYGAVIDAWLIV